jgi:hypothetical protein
MTACSDRDGNLRLAAQLYDHEDDIESLPKALVDTGGDG